MYISSALGIGALRGARYSEALAARMVQPRVGGRTGCLGTEGKGSRGKESKEDPSAGQRKEPKSYFPKNGK